MGEPDRDNQIDNEVPRRADLNPFRGYRTENPEESTPSNSGQPPRNTGDSSTRRTWPSLIWIITIGLLLLLGFMRLGPNPLDWYSAMTEVPTTMVGTIRITSTSCAYEQEVRITPLDADGKQDGRETTLVIDDEGELFPLLNSGCTITFEAEVARAHAYEIAVPSVGQRRLFHESIFETTSAVLRVNIFL